MGIAMPFASIVAIILLWAFVTFPLTAFGAYRGGKAHITPYPCHVKKIRRPLPATLPWYHNNVLLALTAGFFAVYGDLCRGAHDFHVCVGPSAVYAVWHFAADVRDFVGGDFVCGDFDVLLSADCRGLSLVVVESGEGRGVRCVYVRVCHLLLVLYRANDGQSAVFNVFWTYADDELRVLSDVGRRGALVEPLVRGPHL